MNLLGAKRVSIGTTVELAWDASRKPVLVCMEASGNPHDSLHVRGLATYLVEDLDFRHCCSAMLFQRACQGHQIQNSHRGASFFNRRPSFWTEPFFSGTVSYIGEKVGPS